MCHLSQGQVIDIETTDPCGRNKKRRPVVVLTDTDQLPGADEFVVAAISTQFSDPLPSNWIPLPWSRDGRGRSGLSKPCVVKCDWIRRVTRQEVVFIRGWLPATLMDEIMRAVRPT